MFRVEAPSDVWQVIAPCEIVCKCLGLIPAYSGQGLLPWKRWANFVHLIFTVTWVSRSISYCLPLDLGYQESSAVIKKSGAITIVMYYVQPIFGITCCRIVAEKIYQTLMIITSVDSKFTLLGVQKSYVKERKIILGFTVSAFSGCFILITMYSDYPMDIDVEYTIETIFFQLYYSMTCVYATSVSFLTLQRFRMLNKAISKHFPSSLMLDNEPTKGGRPTEHRQRFLLKQIKILLDKLIGTVDLVNDCFAIQISYCVGMSFIIGVFCCFHLSRSLYRLNVTLFMSIVNVIWYIYYVFFILAFIGVGSKIASESKRIGVLVHKAINCCSTSSVVSDELLVFSQQLLHHSPVVTCGMFIYDWTLFYTIIGATATYLIILIQFDISFPSPELTGNGSTVDP